MGLFDAFWQADRATPLATAAMEQVLADEQARRDAMRRAWAAYEGDFPDPLKTKAGQPRDAVKVNRAKRIVNISAFFLFGTLPTISLPVAGEAPEVETDDEAWLEDVLRINQLPAQALDWATNGGITGTGYLRLYPPAQAGGVPTFQVLDSGNMTIHWDPRDITQITGYDWEFNAGTVQYRQVIRAAGAQWTITDQHRRVGSQDDWITDEAVTWPFPWPPILHNKNLPAPNAVYGEPDLTDSIIDLNKALNFNRSNRARIQKHYGHPKAWVKRMGNTGKLDFDVQNLLNLGEEGELGQINPPPANADAEILGREIDSALDEESSTPAVTRGRAELRNPSGVALRIAFWPMAQKTTVKRTLYGPALIELIRRLFDLGGRGPDKIVTLTWPELLPTDPESERRVAVQDQALGVVSRATLAANLGYDWETEQANLELEKALDPEPTVIESSKDANLRAKAETARGGS